MSAEILYNVSQWGIFALLIALLLTAAEAGFWLSRLSRSSYDDAVRAQHSAVQAAALGLLALLLGFTFAMSMTRYESRRGMVIREANVIGTTYLRSKMLSEPQRSEIAALIGRYVDDWLDLAKADRAKDRIRSLREEVDRIQKELWSRAIDIAAKDQKVVPAGLFIQSLNEMIDVDAARMAARENHVPESVLIVLYAASIMSVMLIGYGYGMAGRRNLLSTLTAAILIAVVIMLILDLDRPSRGFIRVSQQSMLDLRNVIAGSNVGH